MEFTASPDMFVRSSDTYDVLLLNDSTPVNVITVPFAWAGSSIQFRYPDL